MKIESYIPLGRFKESHFHIDVAGSLKCEALSRAIDELKLHVENIKILGSYRKNQL